MWLTSRQSRIPLPRCTLLGYIHQDLVEQYADGDIAITMTPFSAQFLLCADAALADAL